MTVNPLPICKKPGGVRGVAEFGFARVGDAISQSPIAKTVRLVLSSLRTKPSWLHLMRLLPLWFRCKCPSRHSLLATTISLTHC